MTWLWGLFAAGALLWPDRISGPFDGVPLDRVAEAVLVAGVLAGALVPSPAVPSHRPRARACILAAGRRGGSRRRCCSCRTAGASDSSRRARFAKDAGRAPHAWDMRADWRSPDPACSAIMTRSYQDLRDFPAWFFNLPPPSESWPMPADRPPARRSRCASTDSSTRADGRRAADRHRAGRRRHRSSVDGVAVARSVAARAAACTSSSIDAVLTGDRWALVPRWNGEDIWSTRRPRRCAGRRRSIWPCARGSGGFRRSPPSRCCALWLPRRSREIGSVAVLAWTAGASLLIGWLRADRSRLAGAMGARGARRRGVRAGAAAGSATFAARS